MRNIIRIGLVFAALVMLVACPQSVSSKPDDQSDAIPPKVGSPLKFSGTSGTATTLAWGAASDDVTADAELEYKAVRAASVGAIDTAAEVNAIKTAGAGLVMDWTANALTASDAGLSETTTYFFAVIVKDAAGNESLYAPASVTTSAIPDTTPPAVGTSMAFTNADASSVTVNWGAASDDVTPAAGLQYKLVRASSDAAIDTAAKVEAITGAGLVMDWTANALSASAAGLSASTTYFFAALVKDAAGNASLYAPASVTTDAPDTTAPTVGATIAWSRADFGKIGISWGAASDGVTDAADLQYKLVHAASSAEIDTVDEVDAIATAGAGLVMEWAGNALSNLQTGLPGGKVRYFAVLVRDAAGNASLYAPVAVVPNHCWDLATDPGWIRKGDWQWGFPSGARTPPAATGACVGTKMTGPYTANLNTSSNCIIIGPIDMSKFSGARKIKFKMWLDLEKENDRDSARVRISKKDYDDVRLWLERPVYNAEISIPGQNDAWKYNMNGGSWTEAEANLVAPDNAFFKDAPTLYVFFQFNSTLGTGTKTAFGFYVDDIEIGNF